MHLKEMFVFKTVYLHFKFNFNILFIILQIQACLFLAYRQFAYSRR